MRQGSKETVVVPLVSVAWLSSNVGRGLPPEGMGLLGKESSLNFLVNFE
jgi:hypothetical protein